VAEMLRLRTLYPKLDMHERAIREFLRPPASPNECIFAQTTDVLSADLKTRVTPCQFGGTPDCSQCGCVASMGLAAVGHHKLGGFISVGGLYWASLKIGEAAGNLAGRLPPRPRPPILEEPVGETAPEQVA